MLVDLVNEKNDAFRSHSLLIEHIQSIGQRAMKRIHEHFKETYFSIFFLNS